MPFEKFGKIIDIQHFSLDDGPGIRTTVFLKGCPLRCAWCHNPESHSIKSEIMFESSRCVVCGQCIDTCPSAVHSIIDGVHILDRGRCTVCEDCVSICPTGALKVAGRDMSVDEVLDQLLLDSVFYKRSGGGMTLSGGEPLMQAEFSERLLRICKQKGINTCVETCGSVSTDVLMRISKVVDLFLFDYKLTDPVMHKKYTGVSNELILKNLDMLCQSGAEVILRCPMIPDVNMDTEHYSAIAQLANSYSAIKEIHLEPYHPLGVAKADAVGKKAVYQRKEFLEKDQLLPVQEFISQKVQIKVTIK